VPARVYASVRARAASRWLVVVARAAGRAGAPLPGLPCVGIRPGRRGFRVRRRLDFHRALAVPAALNGHQGVPEPSARRRAGRACDRSPCPPCRARATSGGRKHSRVLGGALASTGHRGRFDARGRRSGLATGLRELRIVLPTLLLVTDERGAFGSRVLGVALRGPGLSWEMRRVAGSDRWGADGLLATEAVW